MKRFVLLGAIGMLTLVSCKKNFICSCVYNQNEPDLQGEVNDYVITNETKRSAKKICEAKDLKSKLTDCSLKK